MKIESRKYERKQQRKQIKQKNVPTAVGQKARMKRHVRCSVRGLCGSFNTLISQTKAKQKKIKQHQSKRTAHAVNALQSSATRSLFSTVSCVNK